MGSAEDSGRRELRWAAALAEAGFPPQVAGLEGGAEVVLCEHIRVQRIDLLVMSDYGHSHIRDLIVGSTTSAMLRS